MFPIIITLGWVDYRNRRHNTRYHLIATEPPGFVGAARQLAPGIWLSHRTPTMSQEVRRLKLMTELSGWPLVGRVFRKNAPPVP